MAEIKEIISEDYVHSANSLFHFMSDAKYLIAALKRQALCPRYCNEDVTYLRIRHDGDDFNKVAVLLKCFCDIPLRNIFRKFPVRLTDNNDLTEEQRQKLKTELSHTDLYGGYALAFSKKWGETKKLQPIYYLSTESEIVSQFSTMFHEVLNQDDLPDTVADALLNAMCYFKPLRGTMRHNMETSDGEIISCEIFKNFHDEHEWRYVPFKSIVNNMPLDCLIANGAVGSGFLRGMSDKIEEQGFEVAWLTFKYEEIRYIIVPNYSARREIIEAINTLSFDEDIQRPILISKILVLDDIIKDF